MIGAVYSFAIGMVIGSFLNVCIYRLPRELSLIAPGSQCQKCAHALRWRDLVPLLSFIFLVGRCRDCGSRVGWRYPLVEALTGLVFAAGYLRFGLSYELVADLFLICPLLVASAVDIESGQIPDAVSVFLLISGIGLSLTHGVSGLSEALLGGAVGGGMLFTWISTCFAGKQAFWVSI